MKCFRSFFGTSVLPQWGQRSFTEEKRLSCGENCRELLRRVTRREYEDVVDYALSLGIENAFIQEGETAKESFIPDFDESGFL